MVTSKKQVKVPKTRTAEDEKSSKKMIQTRGTRALVAAQERQREKEGGDNPIRRGRLKRTKSKDSEAVKILKKGKPLSPTILEVVFGKTNSSVPDLEELRQKREADAIKCGRVPRTIGKEPPQRQPCSSTTGMANEEDLLMKDNLASSIATPVLPGNIVLKLNLIVTATVKAL